MRYLDLIERMLPLFEIGQYQAHIHKGLTTQQKQSNPNEMDIVTGKSTRKVQIQSILNQNTRVNLNACQA